MKTAEENFKKFMTLESLTKLVDIKEVFITTSIKNTLRGMHYQLAPFGA